MGNSLKTVLAEALDLEVPADLCTTQRAFNMYTKNLCGIKVETPLPEIVAFYPDNFPHLVKLQVKASDGSLQSAKCSIVLPSLQAGDFDESGYQFDPRRERALLNVAQLLRNPDKIFRNLRHGQKGKGCIRGEHIYVLHRHGDFWVAFTTFDNRLGFSVVVSSFYVSDKWLKSCAAEKPLYQRAS